MCIICVVIIFSVVKTKIGFQNINRTLKNSAELNSEYIKNLTTQINDLEDEVSLLENQNNQILSLFQKKVSSIEESILVNNERYRGLLEESIRDNNEQYGDLLEESILINNEWYRDLLEESDDQLEKEIDDLRLLLENRLKEFTNRDIAVDPVDPLDELYSEGFLFFSEKKYVESLKVFSEAFSLYPDNKKIMYHYLSSLYYSNPRKRNNYNLLKEELALLSSDSQYWERALIILAEISLAEDNVEKAAEYYREILTVNNKNYTVIRTLGLLEYQFNNIEIASGYFESYLQFNSEDYEIVYFYGLTLFDRGLYKQALDQFYISLKADKPYGEVDGKIVETIDILKANPEMGDV